MNYDTIWNESDLLLRNKLLQDRVDAFESGEKYVRMQEIHRKAREADLRLIKKLERECADAHRQVIRVRDSWYATCQDILNASVAERKKQDREIERLKKELSKAYAKIQEEHDKRIKKTRELYGVKTELEDAKEKNRGLEAKYNKDFSNSSKSSSMSPNHKVIPNSREKSGKSPGGQKGHIHYGRKRKEPTRKIEIPAPEKYLEDDNYKPTGRIITKQLIRVVIGTEVIEYHTPEFRDQETGQRVHADFPPGIVDDVNYDGSIKALAYLINNDLYTSVNKTRTFLKNISHGNIDVSDGFICNLSKQFSKLTKEEREEIFNNLANAERLHADFTFGRANGKQASVIITTDGKDLLFQGRRKKGDEGVKGSPLENYNGTLISDHEAALIKHGSRHQECMAHVERYARGSVQNELELKWNKQLVDWIKESIGWRNAVCEGTEKYSKRKAQSYISTLRKILTTAKEEYEYDPPSKYNKEGYNLYKRMEENLDEYVLFLRDMTVPPTNNIAERGARKVKRKMSQVMSFRSDEGVDSFCDGLTITESIKARGENVYDEVTKRFNKNLRAWSY